MWEYRATLPFDNSDYRDRLAEAVHDADTVRCLIDLGFDARTEKWIRLAGVRAPETTQPGITQTRNFVITWMRARFTPAPIGMYDLPRQWPLRLRTDVTRLVEPVEKTSFTRYVGTLYDIQSGECLNEVLNAYLAAHPEWPPGKDVGW